MEPIEAKSNIDLPVAEKTINVQHHDAEIKNQMWFINYGKELQGLVITDRDIESHHYDIHTALLNTFLNDSFAMLILEGYMMALIKQTNVFYLFDSHARDFNGMPDPNGTAVVMKFSNIVLLEQFLYCLSTELHTSLFEIVSVHLNKCDLSKQKTKHVKDRDYQKKRRCVETEHDKQVRLKKANEYKKRKQSEETACGRQIRLQKVNESLKRKFSQEIVSEREIRLRKDSMSKKKKRSVETASETKNRLQNNNVYKKTKQSKETVSEKQSRLQKDSAYRKKKRLAETDNERGIRLEKDRLHKKDKISNGGIEEQCWAKANIIKFHKSVQYNVSQCTVCWEAWPLKSKQRSPYVCSRCSRDKQTLKSFLLKIQ